MKKFFCFILLINLIYIDSVADEGMWLPHLLHSINESDMQNAGLKLTAEDIYNVNSSSLKDAIVSLGGFCTGEMISSNGLMLTNHHCAFDVIQTHSSVDNDYLFDVTPEKIEYEGYFNTAAEVHRVNNIYKELANKNNIE